MNYDQIWSKVLEDAKLEVSSLIYKTWFECTRLYKIENNEVSIVVPFAITRDRLNNVYLNDIKRWLQQETNQQYEINILLEDELTINENLSTTDVDNSKNVDKIEYNYSSNLNKHYTFDNFVIGNSNRLAHATALAVAESPGEIYNPLFIYGSSGLGKTHLMHAIGNYIVENSNKKVIYVSSEQFTDEFTKISRDTEYADYFKKKYRSVDVLIIDDIQYFAARPKTQEEFFNTFNILHHENKQIIISSDRSPNDLKLLEDRLKTRFCWGLAVDIFPPDLELRKNILRKKIQANNLLPEIDEEVIDYIASNVSSDVRSLVGAINRLMAESLTFNIVDKITLPIAVQALKTTINKGTSEKPNILRVQNVVADHYKISVDDLKSKKRSAVVAGPRQIAMYLSRSLLNESFERIGLEFGGKDHSSVMHACNKIKEEMENNESLRDEIDKIKSSIL